MTTDEALELADEWFKVLEEYPIYVTSTTGGWRVVCKVLADEVRELRQLVSDLCSVVPADQEQLKRIADLVKDVKLEDHE